MVLSHISLDGLYYAKYMPQKGVLSQLNNLKEFNYLIESSIFKSIFQNFRLHKLRHINIDIWYFD